MKRIKLFFQFYRGNALPALILAAVMTIAFCSVSFAVGQYRFITRAKNMLLNSGLENALFYMPDFEEAGEDLFDAMGGPDKLPEQFRALPGVEAVLSHPVGSLSYLGRGGGFNLYSEEMLEIFPPDIVQGGSFSETEDPNVPPEAIVGGSTFQDVRVGSDITVDFYDYAENELIKKSLTIHVVGKLRYPAYVPNFMIGGHVSADMLFRDSSVAIFRDTPAIRAKLVELDEEASDFSSLFVKLRADCTPQQREEVVAFIEKTGSYATLDEILENTDIFIEKTLNRTFPAPLFFLFISTMALLCVSTLLVQKKLGEHSVYYLCGCGRRKSFLYMFAGIGGIALLAGLLNILILVFYPWLSWKGIVNWGTVYIDGYSSLFVLCYLAVVVPLSSVLPYLTFRSASPIELYRRKEQ